MAWRQAKEGLEETSEEIRLEAIRRVMAKRKVGSRMGRNGGKNGENRSRTNTGDCGRVHPSNKHKKGILDRRVTNKRSSAHTGKKDCYNGRYGKRGERKPTMERDQDDERPPIAMVLKRRHYGLIEISDEQLREMLARMQEEDTRKVMKHKIFK